MENDIQKSIEIYKEQLSYGHIQIAYSALTKFVAELKSGFPTEYRTGNISFGYLDYTYFPFFNEYLRNHKLRFGVVLNHEKMQFELWLMGQNADVQKKYWEILKSSEWNINRKELPKYSVLEVVLENQIDFTDKENMAKKVISRSLSLALEIQKYLLLQKKEIMDYPLTLYYNTKISNVQTLDLCHGDNDYRKVYIVDDGNKKLVIKHLSNTFSDKRRIEGWFHLMDEYRKSGLYCPSIVPNCNGELLHKYTVNDRDYYVYAEEFAKYRTAEDIGKDKCKDINGKWLHIPDVLRSVGIIASKRFDFLDFPSAYCLLEPFAGIETTDEVTECALLFIDYIKENLPQHLPRAEKLLDLFYKNQEECRKVYYLLPESCFQADLNSSNILLDDELKFVGLIDFNLCGKDKILNYAMREALWGTYQKCMVDENNNYLFYFDKALDDIRMKTFLQNMAYIQETYTFNDDEKRAFPILLRYINTFWWYSLEDLKRFSSDDKKVERILDWFEYQMTRDDIRLL